MADKPKNLDLPPLGKLTSLEAAEKYLRQIVRVIDGLNRRLAEVERKQNNGG